MKIYKQYQDVPEKYRFDLEYILEGQKPEELLAKWVKIKKELVEVKDSKYDSESEFLKALKKGEKADLIFNKLYNYVSNNLNTNLVSQEFNRLYQEMIIQYTELEKESGSEINRIYKHAKKIKQWLKLPEFQIYEKNLSHTLKMKKHTLKPEVEEYLNQTAGGNIDLTNVFGILTDSEVEYPDALDSKGKKHQITEGTYMSLMQSKDEVLRKNTFLNYFGTQYKNRQSLAVLLISQFKRISTEASVRKYKSAVQSLISSDNIEESLLKVIFENVQKNMPIFYKFYAAKKRFFKQKFGKTPKRWDASVKLIDIKGEYDIEAAEQMVLKAVEPLGKEYTKTVEKAFADRWVDYFNVPNKRSGAYSIGNSYGLDKKYILMNYDGTLNAVSTLAHEMGHSMHSYFSTKHQPQELADYPIFLAEIASVFNQLMLTDYLLKDSKSDKLRFYLLGEAIKEFDGTVVRQIMWSEYEYNLYAAMDEKQPLSTFEDLEKIYESVASKYRTDKMNKEWAKEKNKATNIRAVNVPHFYYNFYVYKYAVGYIAANAFFQKYKIEGEAALQLYIKNFLSAGGNEWPVELLKNAGVDLYDENIYNLAYQTLDNMVNEYISLGNKIFKNSKGKK